MSYNKHKTHTPNARFWVWHNGQATKITLKDSQTIFLRSYSPHDEGYNYSQSLFRFVNNTVYVERESGGRDCDGIISSYCDQECPLEELNKGYSSEETHEGKEIVFPDWKTKNQRAYDQYAEMAGY